MTAAQSILEAVARRLEEDPQHILPTLRLLGDLDALPDTHDAHSLALARDLNAERLAERQRTFRQRALTTSQMRAVLGGITRQAVADRVKAGSLLKLELAGRSYFPDWQIGPDGPVPGLSQVLTALRGTGRGALAADALMRAPLPETGNRSPADLLAQGDLDSALHYILIAGV